MPRHPSAPPERLRRLSRTPRATYRVRVTRDRRGAPRSEAARAAILEATAQLVVSRGWDRLTIEGIAARAGVGKQTIYRWWPSRSALITECLLEGMLLEQVPVPDTGDLRADLRSWLSETLRGMEDENGAGVLRAVVAAALEDEGLAIRLRDAIGAPRVLQDRLLRAQEAEPHLARVSVATITDALAGMIIMQIISRASPDASSGLALLDTLLPPPRL